MFSILDFRFESLGKGSISCERSENEESKVGTLD